VTWRVGQGSAATAGEASAAAEKVSSVRRESSMMSAMLLQVARSPYALDYPLRQPRPQLQADRRQPIVSMVSGLVDGGELPMKRCNRQLRSCRGTA
jgi:hypothetical protein